MDSLGEVPVRLPEEPAVSRAEEVYEEALRFFGRHLVCLIASYVHLEDQGRQVGDERVAAFSGFVMSFGDEWFFVTAGHALKDGLDGPLATGQVRLHHVGFHDSLGGQAKYHLPTLIDYESVPRWYVDDRSLGLDVGIMHLRPLYRAGLEANGIVPVTEENWVTQPADELTHYYMFGVPDELTGPVRRGPGPTGESLLITVYPRLLPVERTDTPHRPLPPSAYPWFIGRVQALFGLTSIVGMSGGPIFGLKQMPGGEWRYWVVALQSWWDRETKTVYGCPVPIFAGLIADWLATVGDGGEEQKP